MKTFTTIFFALGLLLATFLASAQSKSYKMYESMADRDGVTSFTFSKNMQDAFDIDLGDDGDEKQVKGDLHEVRFMSYNPEKGTWGNEAFIAKAVSLLPAKYKKFESDEPDPGTEIWLLGGKKKFKECHVFLHNDNPEGNAFVVSFYGDFTVNDLDGLKETGKGFSE